MPTYAPLLWDDAHDYHLLICRSQSPEILGQTDLTSWEDMVVKNDFPVKLWGIWHKYSALSLATALILRNHCAINPWFMYLSLELSPHLSGFAKTQLTAMRATIKCLHKISLKDFSWQVMPKLSLVCSTDLLVYGGTTLYELCWMVCNKSKISGTTYPIEMPVKFYAILI